MANNISFNLNQLQVTSSQATLLKSEEMASTGYDRMTFEKTVVETYVEICLFIIKDSNDRMIGYQENPSLLEKGVFYANDHCMAMQAMLPKLSEKTNQAKQEYSEMLNKILQQKGHEPLKLASETALEKYTKLLTQYSKLQNLYDRLYQAGSYYHGYQNPEYFDLIKSGESHCSTGFEISKFNIKPGFQPTEIIDAFNNGLTFTDCGVSIDTAARYNTLRKIWGDEKFNIVFACSSKTAINYDILSKSPVSIFLKEIDGDSMPKRKSLAGRRAVKRGQRCFIKNSKIYHSKHYNGNDGSFNIICLNDKPHKQRFIGFGLIPEGLSEKQINEYLLQSYNAEPINLKILPEKYHAAFKTAEIYSKNALQKLDKKQYEDTEGGQFVVYDEEFHTDRIWEVDQAPIHQVRALVDSWVKPQPSKRDQCYTQ